MRLLAATCSILLYGTEKTLNRSVEVIESKMVESVQGITFQSNINGTSYGHKKPLRFFKSFKVLYRLKENCLPEFMMQAFKTSSVNTKKFFTDKVIS